MKFNIVKEEYYDYDFVETNLEKIFACIMRRDEFLKYTFGRKKNSIRDLFESNGLMTSGIEPSLQFELSTFWEGFAEFILQKDFKFCGRECCHNIEMNESIDMINIDISNKDVLESESRLRSKENNILCDIFKQKYEFECISHEIISIQTIEKNGIDFYIIPFNKFIFTIPKKDIEDIRKKLFRPCSDFRERYGLTPIPMNLNCPTPSLLRDLLTHNEKDEYYAKCIGTQEYIDLELKKAEIITNSYKSILERNDIILSDKDLQSLKDCLTSHPTTLDLFGIKKPTASSYLHMPFYFIEIKSTNKEFRYARLNTNQQRFIEKVKDKFGVLILQIKISPDNVDVRHLLT